MFDILSHSNGVNLAAILVCIPAFILQQSYDEIFDENIGVLTQLQRENTVGSITVGSYFKHSYYISRLPNLKYLVSVTQY